jgi:hypothetical protein
MDPFILAAATAIVSSMATEAWQQARSAIGGLWRRTHPERVAAIDGELAEVRGEVLAAREAGDGSAEQDLAAEWALKLKRLLSAGESGDPGLRDELERIVDEDLRPLLPPAEQARITQITMTAKASGHGRVYQAGRDQRINET